MSVRADRSRFRFLVAITAGLLAAAVLAIGLTIWWLRSDEIGDATRDTGNLATVLAEQTNLAVQSIDLVFNDIQERLENLGAKTQDNFAHLQQDKNTYHSLLDSLSHLSQAALIARQCAATFIELVKKVSFVNESGALKHPPLVNVPCVII